MEETGACCSAISKKKAAGCTCCFSFMNECWTKRMTIIILNRSHARELLVVVVVFFGSGIA